MGFRIRIDEPGDHPRVVDVVDPVEVGRQADGIRLFDPTVSRRHVRLEATADGLVVADLGSSYGSFVHGYRLAGPVLLQPGDVVQLGNARLTVLGPLPSGAAPSPPPAGAEPEPAGALDQTVATGLTPPPPTSAPGLTPPPPTSAVDAVPAPPAASPWEEPHTPPPVAPVPSAPMPPGPPPASGPAPSRSRATSAVASNVAVALALALPVGLLVTVADLMDGELLRDDLGGRLVVLGGALLVTVAGLLGVTTLRARVDLATVDAPLEERLRVDRQWVATGVLPAWALVSAVGSLLVDPLVGLLVTVAALNVGVIWLWVAHRPDPPAPDEPGDPVRPPARQLAVVAIALLGALAIVVTGLAAARAFDGDLSGGGAVLVTVAALQVPLPLLGLLRV